MAVAGVLGMTVTAGAIDLPQELGGLPKDAPARPTTQRPYPGVYDQPRARPESTMSDSAKIKLEGDLDAARKRQQQFKEGRSKDGGAAAAAQAAAARDKAQNEAKKKPSAPDSR
ncbi:MAG: hypothetical protein JOZ70_07395 [Pseudolabrys sp.]|nr:hypothetical protein [Pseudolabrys sp.]MBV9955059.1 hypothetical protein [Pseudolabrys sp.]